MTRFQVAEQHYPATGPLRFIVSPWHGEAGTIFTVIDRKRDRVRGQTSTWRQGAEARAMADAMANRLNREESPDA